MLKLKHVYPCLVVVLILTLGLLGAAGCGDNVLFSDDFSQDNGDWEVFSDDNGQVFYEDGWLHLINYTTAPYDTMTITDHNFSDFILEVETKFIAGDDNNWHGVICRYQGNGSYYVFDISADGYYRIGRFLEHEQSALVEGNPSSYINVGTDVVNDIHIECIGSIMSLTVNGQLLATVTDNAFSSGSIGLLATSWDGDFSEIAFDNLVVTEAEKS